MAKCVNLLSADMLAHINGFVERHHLPVEFSKTAMKIAREQEAITLSELKLLEIGFLLGCEYQKEKIKVKLKAKVEEIIG